MQELESLQNGMVLGGMSYGNPSISAGARTVSRARESTEIVVFPLYPQYSLSATESSMARYAEACEAGGAGLAQFRSGLLCDAGFIDAFAQVAREALAGIRSTITCFSVFTGCPSAISQRRIAPAARIAFKSRGLLRRDRSKPIATATAPSASRPRGRWRTELGLAPDQYTVCFQSRLGRTPWIQALHRSCCTASSRARGQAPGRLCPSFVADCLETLEEIGIRGRRGFHPGWGRGAQARALAEFLGRMGERGL